MVPTVEAERAADALERDDVKPWDEDFRLALMLALDRFAAERLAEYLKIHRSSPSRTHTHAR